MLSKVTTWQMTEEERLAYIKKHPIRPASEDEKRGASYTDIHDKRKKKDYKWRSEKGAMASKESREKE